MDVDDADDKTDQSFEMQAKRDTFSNTFADLDHPPLISILVGFKLRIE